MKSRATVVIVSGMLSMIFGLAFLNSLHTYWLHGSRFHSVIGSSRISTTLSTMASLAAATLFFSVCFLSSLFVSHSPRNTGEPTVSPDGTVSSWDCPECHETNPNSFDECWKCQVKRSTPRRN